MVERMGHKLPAMLAAGVFMVEVSKQTHPQKGHMMKNRVRSPIRMLEGLSNRWPSPPDTQNALSRNVAGPAAPTAGSGRNLRCAKILRVIQPGTDLAWGRGQQRGNRRQKADNDGSRMPSGVFRQ